MGENRHTPTRHMQHQGCLSKLDVLIAAPSDPLGRAGWGDFHFARALQRALGELQILSRLLFRDQLDGFGIAPNHDLLVIRGKFRPNSEWLRNSRYRQRILWIISWPLDISSDELEDYDLILVASSQDRPRIAALSQRTTYTLQQATEFRCFSPAPMHDGSLLFIGNTRGLQRPIVQNFAEAHCPLALIGKGWQKWGLHPEKVSIANGLLPLRYSQALAVLNDHHGAMRDYGYMNNRIYDVLACAVPVITDQAPDCPPELLPGVILHQPGQDDPAQSLEKARRLRRQPEILMEVARRVRQSHSFAARAKTLLPHLIGAKGVQPKSASPRSEHFEPRS